MYCSTHRTEMVELINLTSRLKDWVLCSAMPYSVLMLLNSSLTLSLIVGSKDSDDITKKQTCICTHPSNHPLKIGTDIKKMSNIRYMWSNNCVAWYAVTGNNGSFSIEVQVARCGDENFYSLISATTFMSANDSRSATNKFAVRMFKAGM